MRPVLQPIHYIDILKTSVKKRIRTVSQFGEFQDWIAEPSQVLWLRSNQKADQPEAETECKQDKALRKEQKLYVCLF